MKDVRATVPHAHGIRVTMPTDYTTQFIVVATCGIAVVLVGAVNLLAARFGRLRRTVLTAAVAAIPLTALVQFGPGTLSLLAVFAAVAGLFLVAELVGTWAGRTVTGRRAVAWIGLLALGALTVAGSAVRYDRAMDDDETASVTDVMLSEHQPLLELVDSHAVTDRGHAVAVKKPAEGQPADPVTDRDERQLRTRNLLMRAIRLAPADDTANCHGWVFAAGQFWIGGTQVNTILDDNGYFHVLKPSVGDLVVYRNETGEVTHSAIVRATPEHLPVLVESKWGSLGVFLHPIDESPYGTDFTVYHSDRPGHVLAGLVSHPGEHKTDAP
jgi:hypothetical protein